MNFFKMQALGNDFLVVFSESNQDPTQASDEVSQTLLPQQSWIQRLGDRRLGVGFDQLLWVSPLRDEKAVHPSFHYAVFNQDGRFAEQCGNGARAVSFLLWQKGWAPKAPLMLRTPSGVLKDANGNEHFELSNPRWMKVSPLESNHALHAQVRLGVPKFLSTFMLESGEAVYVVDVGNPHAVVLMQTTANNFFQVAENIVRDVATEVRTHESRFPEGVNVSVVQHAFDEGRVLEILTDERGAGITPSCGSASAACVASLVHHGLIDEGSYTLRASGGVLQTAYAPSLDSEIIQSGEATLGFELLLSPQLSAIF